MLVKENQQMSGPPIPCCSLKISIGVKPKDCKSREGNQPSGFIQPSWKLDCEMQFAANCPRCLLVDVSMLEDQA